MFCTNFGRAGRPVMCDQPITLARNTPNPQRYRLIHTLTTAVQPTTLSTATKPRGDERSLNRVGLTGRSALPTAHRPRQPRGAGSVGAATTKNSVDFHCKNILDGPRSRKCRKRSIMRHGSLTPRTPPATKATTEWRHARPAECREPRD